STLWIALVGMVLIAGVAAAEEDAVTKALEECQPEIETYCSQVTPGEGRLLACFIAHEDKLSGACGWALYEASAALEEFVAAIAHVASECHEDLIKFCGDVQVGEGRVGICLLEHEEKVTAGCKQAMADTELEVVED
ncbi:MAG: cysteine rich repeat-containing protein, partial [Thermoanaerobaculia bacterium]